MARFSVNVESFADKTPILPVGVYAGQLAYCASTGKENKQYITIQDSVQWKDGQKILTGGKELAGFIMTGAILTDEKAKEILLVDEPKVYGMMRLIFNQDTGMLDLGHNVALKQLLNVLEIDFNEIQANAEDAVDFDSVEIPDELSGVDNIETLYPAMLFHREVFAQLCVELNGRDVRVSITQRKNRTNASVMEHTIDNGTPQAPFCGFLAALN